MPRTAAVMLVRVTAIMMVVVMQVVGARPMNQPVRLLGKIVGLGVKLMLYWH